MSNTVRYKNTPIHQLITYFQSFVPCTAMSCIITLKNPALMRFPHISCYLISLLILQKENKQTKGIVSILITCAITVI